MTFLNKRTALFIITVVLATLVSCKPSPRSAQRYYENVTDVLEPLLLKEDKLIMLINTEMKKTVGGVSVLEKKEDTLGTVDYKVLDNTYFDFRAQAEQSLNDAGKLEPFNGETALKDALLALLQEYNQVAAGEYQEILKIVKIKASSYTNEDDNNFITLTEKVDDRLQARIDVFTRESKIFAMKYKFEITTDKDTIPNK